MMTEVLLSVAVTLTFAWVALQEYISRLKPNDPQRPDLTDSARPVQLLLAGCIIGGNIIIWMAGSLMR